MCTHALTEVGVGLNSIIALVLVMQKHKEGVEEETLKNKLYDGMRIS